MIQRMRVLGWLEGVSLIVLVFVAMPLKYMGDMPIYVRIAGTIHGIFFPLYCLQLAYVGKKLSWRLDKSLTFFVAALIPFATFMLDGRLKEEEAAYLKSRS